MCVCVCVCVCLCVCVSVCLCVCVQFLTLIPRNHACAESSVSCSLSAFGFFLLRVLFSCIDNLCGNTFRTGSDPDFLFSNLDLQEIKCINFCVCNQREASNQSVGTNIMYHFC